MPEKSSVKSKIMKLSIHNIFICSFLVLFFSACQSSKHFTKLGTKQEQAGLIHEAANSYYTALYKNRTNLDAQIGMKKTGQLVLNEMLNNFAKERNFGTNKSAVYAYHPARDYRDKIQGVGITLILADFYDADYKNAVDAYLHELYDEGTSLLESEKYTEAGVKFDEIRKLDTSFKDANDLGDVAFLEPLYQQATKAMAAEHYREAYDSYGKVVERKIDYKDAMARKKECLEKGIYTVALMNFENASGTSGIEAKVSAYALDALTGINDPFLRIVDRENLQTIMEEQHLQLSGVIDENTAVQVGQLVGAQALLTGTVLSYGEKKGTLRSLQRDGYTSYLSKELNKTDGKYYSVTRYKETSYTEYYNSNSCAVSFQFKLINLKTGEILKTEIIQKEVADEVIYGRFEGDVNSLFPSGQGGPNLNAGDKRALMNMMNSRQQVKTSAELSNELFGNISTQLSKTIGQTVREIVQ
jgi:curli biogenesis system outer membrane secretion channel CsgG